MDPVNALPDNGVLVKRRRFRISWVWLFPIMAMTAVGVMYYKQWRNEGPEIYVEFASAPGMKSGKTLLYYRGVEAGVVSDVKLSKDLSKAVLRVRLHSHAADLAREGTLFWIDQPVFNLTKPSGIQSLVEGNSLQAKKGSGNVSYYFLGCNEIPIDPLEDDMLFVRLTSPSIPLVEPGGEVFFRGLSVGSVRNRGIDDSGNPYLEIGFPKRYASLVRSNARFWELIPWSMKIGSGVFELDVSSLKTFLIGGIAFDYYGPRGEEIPSGKTFQVATSEELAKAVSEPVTLEFKNGQGIQEGMTQLRYLGQPVGIVESVKAAENKVIVTARFRTGYDFLRARGAVFSIVRPRFELQKVSGLETIVSGIYIDCIPGSGGGLAAKFRGTSQEDADLLGESRGNFEVRLTSSSSKISPGTPVLYRGLKVGIITRKGLSKDGTGVVLTAAIDNQYADLLHENTRFWNISGVKISGGLINLNVQATAFESKGLGGVEFATPAGEAGGESVDKGHVYELFETPKKEWLQWALPGFK
jgi:paraquat-inducible protein B